MKLIHIKITFRDCFSKCISEKFCTRSEYTFLKMQNGIGQTVKVFENNISYLFEVVSVEQA